MNEQTKSDIDFLREGLETDLLPNKCPYEEGTKAQKLWLEGGITKWHFWQKGYDKAMETFSNSDEEEEDYL